MADDHGKKKDGEKPKEEKKESGHGEKKTALPWYINAAFETVGELFGHRIGDALLGAVAEWITGKGHRIENRHEHLISFGEALVALQRDYQHDYDVIRDFMKVSLTEDADRNDFQVRTARMGGDKVEITVAFLRLVAAEPDHASRKEFLEVMGLIGERAMDPLERTWRFAKSIWNFAKIHAPQMWRRIKADIDKANAMPDEEGMRLDRELQALLDEEASAATAAGRGWKDRISRAWATLRGR